MLAELFCQDWREADVDAVRPLLAAEVAAWDRDLDWDARESWSAIEPARAAGALPGVLVYDSHGQVAGWAWFLLHQEALQVAALSGTDAQVVRALVDRVFESPEAARATQQIWSVRGVPPGLESALEDHGLRTGRYLYLSAPVRSCRIDLGVRRWRPSDIDGAVALSRRAYDNGQLRAFAPGGTDLEWRQYWLSIFGTDGCGTVMPEASFVVDARDGGLAGAIVTSRIGRRTAHIPQVLIDPSAQRNGLGRRLVDTAMSACLAQGFDRMTLLVSESNLAARALYARVGFTEQSQFVVASSAAKPRA